MPECSALLATASLTATSASPAARSSTEWPNSQERSWRRTSPAPAAARGRSSENRIRRSGVMHGEERHVVAARVLGSEAVDQAVAVRIEVGPGGGCHQAQRLGPLTAAAPVDQPVGVEQERLSWAPRRYSLSTRSAVAATPQRRLLARARRQVTAAPSGRTSSGGGMARAGPDAEPGDGINDHTAQGRRQPDLQCCSASSCIRARAWPGPSPSTRNARRTLRRELIVGCGPHPVAHDVSDDPPRADHRAD